MTRANIAAQLRAVLDPGAVSDDPGELALYAPRNATGGSDLPLCAARVKTADDVGRVLIVARRLETSVVPASRGAGRSAVAGKVVLDVRGLDAPLWPRADDRSVFLAAGAAAARVEGVLRDAGLTLGVTSPTQRADSVGAWFARGNPGAETLAVGTFADRVLGGNAVLADGAEIRFEGDGPLPDPWHDLLAGSSGRWAVITGLDVAVQPAARLFRTATLACPQVDIGLDLMRAWSTAGLHPSHVLLRPHDRVAEALTRPVLAPVRRALQRWAAHAPSEWLLRHMAIASVRRPLQRPVRLDIAHGGAPGVVDVEFDRMSKMALARGARVVDDADPVDLVAWALERPFRRNPVAHHGTLRGDAWVTVPWGQAEAILAAVVHAAAGQAWLAWYATSPTPQSCVLLFEVACRGAGTAAAGALQGVLWRAMRAARRQGALDVATDPPVPDPTHRSWHRLDAALSRALDPAAVFTVPGVDRPLPPPQPHPTPRRWWLSRRRSLAGIDAREADVLDRLCSAWRGGPSLRVTAGGRASAESVDLSALATIFSVRRRDRTLTCGVGCDLATVAAAAADVGLALPSYAPWLAGITVAEWVLGLRRWRLAVLRLPLGPARQPPWANVMSLDVVQAPGDWGRLLRTAAVGHRPGFAALVAGAGPAPLVPLRVTLALHEPARDCAAWAWRDVGADFLSALQTTVAVTDRIDWLGIAYGAGHTATATVGLRIDGREPSARRGHDLVLRTLPAGERAEPDDPRVIGPLPQAQSVRPRRWPEPPADDAVALVRCLPHRVWESRHAAMAPTAETVRWQTVRAAAARELAPAGRVEVVDELG
jgi:FAD/FMN-containing dehydrogenase